MSEDGGEVVNALVERLDAGAELVGVGGFTLDHAKAWDKLGTYRLADPNSFAVLFVEAAVLLGCEEVDIDQQPEATTIRLIGVSLAPNELRQLLDAPFARAPTDDAALARRLEGRRALAFGVVAATGLPGATCVLHSHGSAVEWSLTVASGGAVEVEQRDAEGRAPMIRLVLRESLGLVAQVRGQREATFAARGRVVALRSRFAPIIVRVDRVRHDVGSSTAELVDPQPVREGDRLLGQVGRAPLRRRATIVFVANGIVVEEVELDDASVGVAAKIDASGLSRDLSHLRLRRDNRFHSITAQVEDALQQLPSDPRPVPMRLPSRGDQEELLRIVGMIAAVFVVIGVGFATAGGPGGFLGAMFAIGGLGVLGIVRFGFRQLRVEREGLPGVATIEKIGHVSEAEASRIFEVVARVEALGIAPREESFQLTLPKERGPVRLGSRYYVRVDPGAKTLSVVERE